jgi:hypothetical protein
MQIGKTAQHDLVRQYHDFEKNRGRHMISKKIVGGTAYHDHSTQRTSLASFGLLLRPHIAPAVDAVAGVAFVAFFFWSESFKRASVQYSIRLCVPQRFVEILLSQTAPLSSTLRHVSHNISLLK